MAQHEWAQYFSGQYSPSEAAILWRDSAYHPAQTLVVMAHGYAAGAVDYLTTYRNPPAQITKAGFPVLTADFGGSSTWGNDTEQSAMSAAITWAQTQTGVKSGSVLLYGGSMGCLSVCNWAINNPTKVKGIILVLPAVDLQDLHDNRFISTPGDLVTPIETAYTNNAGYLAALSTHSPNVNRTSLARFPIQTHYSADDAVVPIAVSTAFGTAVGADQHSLGAVGHTAVNQDYTAIRNFLLAKA